MTWTPQSTTTINWQSSTGAVSTWSGRSQVESGWIPASRNVVIYPGPGTFNVVGQMFNQRGFEFNRTVHESKKDVNWQSQQTIQTSWRHQ